MELQEAEEEEEEEVRPVTFDIDLNETPVSSPPAAGDSSTQPETASLDRKGKAVILDINAVPSDDDDDEEMKVGRDVSSVGNLKNSLVTGSHISFVGNRCDPKKEYDNLTSFHRPHLIDVEQQMPMFGRNLKEGDPFSMLLRRHWSGNSTACATPFQAMGEVLLQALRQFIIDKHGVLEDGWHVEFPYCHKRCERIAVFCSPNGMKFESMFDVARYLDVVSYSYDLVPQVRREEFSLLQSRTNLRRRRKEPLGFSRTRGFKECQENFKNNYSGEVLLGTENLDSATCKLRSATGVQEDCSVEIDGFHSSQCEDGFPVQYEDGFPVQYEDFFILSVGNVDPRHSYHSDSQIWPVGYTSSWHDKITGSLFVCNVSDGGDCGPIFRVQRYPCSAHLIPIGSTILSRPGLGVANNKANTSWDMNEIEDIDLQMIFSDFTPPHLDFSILSGIEISMDESSDFHPADVLVVNSSNFLEDLDKHAAMNKQLGDDIGEFLVEGRSSSSVWRLVSQNLVDACNEVYKQNGECNFCCKHDVFGWRSSCSVPQSLEVVDSIDSLAKFSYMSGPLDVPCHIKSNDVLTVSCEALTKWLDQDRFGLDVEFVQEIIEQLPGAHAFSDYMFLHRRIDKSKPHTVRNGHLLAKRGSNVQRTIEEEDVLRALKKSKKQMDYHLPKDLCPPCKPLSSQLPANLIGDLLQSWELLWRFSEVLGLEESVSFRRLEEELLDCYSFCSSSASLGKRILQNGLTLSETDYFKQDINVRPEPNLCGMCCGEKLTKAHCSMLKVLLAELQYKIATLVDPTFECGESKSRKRRKTEADNLSSAKKAMRDLLPINELTWPEIARRYLLIVSSVEGSLDLGEILRRDSCKVFQCLQGHCGVFNGSLPGVAGMEADALLLAEAEKQIYGLSWKISENIMPDSNGFNQTGTGKSDKVSESEIPDWAKVLEPVRKLPTNVGARIRNCVYEALLRNPPKWAQKRLEHSISREVYKGNASGPTKRAVLSVLADVHGKNWEQKPSKKRNVKLSGNLSDVIMKQCQKILRLVVAADEKKVFCNLLGRMLRNASENDDETLDSFPFMVSRPLDFRSIDLRLAFGAYGGSHEAFVEDVREVWHQIRTICSDRTDLVRLAETLSQNFETLYEKEVLTLVHKLADYADAECDNSEAHKEMENILKVVSEIPKAPWDEGVCKVCGADRDDYKVLLCDKCDSGYHTYCLNPPLTKIPGGSWYCPSCANSPSANYRGLQVFQLNSQFQRKGQRRELTHGFVEALTHLCTTMEVKDYWEYSMEERILLLRLLGDELLNSSRIREHLDQCASVSTDLQVKLRSLYAEWQNLKFKDLLAEKVAKVNRRVGNGVGICKTDGLSFPFATLEKQKEQTLSCSSLMPASYKPLHLEADFWHFQENDIATERCHCYSQGVVSRLSKTGSSFECLIHRHSRKDNGHVLENSSNDILHSHAKDDLGRQNKPVAVSHNQNYVSNGDYGGRSNFNKEAVLKRDKNFIMPISEDVPQGNLPLHTFESSIAENELILYMNSEKLFPFYMMQPSVDELQSCNIKENFIKSRLSVLQDSIASIKSDLEKVSMRKDLLGSDSGGRLYWAFLRPGSSPWVVIDGNPMGQHLVGKQNLSSSNLNFNSSPGIPQNPWTYQGTNVSCQFRCKQIDDIPPFCQWFSYQSEAEIEELIKWLGENGPAERALLESISQCLHFGGKDPSKAGDCMQEPASQPKNGKGASDSSTCVTRALTALEKKYGPLESNIPSVKRNLSEILEVTPIKKLRRCECLEPIWPHRFHCEMCHHSFCNGSELELHNDGKCRSTLLSSVKSKVNDNVRNMKTRTEQGDYSENTQCESICTQNEVDYGMDGCDSESPFDIDEIITRFATKNSNVELVKEIGLLGSNGVPSFLPVSSPYLNDPSLRLATSWDHGIDQRGMSRKTENQSSRSVVYEEVEKNERSNSNFGLRDQSSFIFRCPKRNGNVTLQHDSSLRPLFGRGRQILKHLKTFLLDMDAALPEEALKLSKACFERRCSWRAFVKSAKSVYEMVQATIVFEDMIKTEYLKTEWWYWSSLSAASRVATISSLALRLFTLDAAIFYEKHLSISVLGEPPPTISLLKEHPTSTSPLEEPADIGEKSGGNSWPPAQPRSIAKPRSKPVPKTVSKDSTENSKPQSKSTKKRKVSGG